MSKIPWFVFQSFTSEPEKTGPSCCRINAADGSVVGFVADYANAEMIVNAVNEYSDLIKAIEQVKEELEDMAAGIKKP